MARGCRLDGEGWSSSAMREDDRDLPANKIGRQPRQPIVLALRPAIFDDHVVAINVTGFAQPFEKGGQGSRAILGRRDIDKPYYRHW